MLRKKTISILAAIAAASVALVACGGGQTASNGGGGAESGGEAAAEKVTVNLMHLWPEGSSAQQYKLVNQIIDEYTAANPNVEIKQEILDNEQYKNKLKVLSASNQLPDVGMTWAAGFLEPYVSGKLFAPLDDVLAEGLKEKFVSGTTEAYAIDGVTYGLPLELNISPIYYNKAIFEQYGLSVPQTYEQFLQVVQTLADNGVAPIALGNKDRWTGSLWYMYLADRIGGKETLTNAINRTGTFEDPSLVRAGAEIQKLVDMNAYNKGFNGLSNDEGKSEFMNGAAAMYMMGTWELPNFTTNPDVPEEFKKNVGFFKFPAVEGGKGDLDSWVGGPGVGMFIAENSKVKDEAKKFVKFFIESWGQHSVMDAGVIPATKVDTATLDLPQLYIDLLNELNNASNITLFADVQMKPKAAQTHLDMIQSLFGKAATPEEFAKAHEEALQLGQ